MALDLPDLYLLRPIPRAVELNLFSSTIRAESVRSPAAGVPDAPRPRDHFQAAVHEGKLYAAAGRTTVAATNPFANTIGEVDVYDLANGSWSTLTDTLPTHRAGNAAITLDDRLLILGGESTAHQVAHNEVEALALPNGAWTSLDSLSRGRHGTGVIHYGNQLIMASGCGNRGGSPELGDVIAAKGFRGRR